MKFGQLIEYIKQYLNNYAQNVMKTNFWDIKIEHISGSIVQHFIQFAFIVCSVEGYGSILQLSYGPLAFTSFKGKLNPNIFFVRLVQN